MESGESPQQAARREVREETGLALGDLRFVSITNNVFSAVEKADHSPHPSAATPRHGIFRIRA